jgi:hypothetical protein
VFNLIAFGSQGGEIEKILADIDADYRVGRIKS